MGGDEELARRLGVPTHLVNAWGDGQSYPPDRVFMRIVDIMMELYWEDSPLSLPNGHLSAPVDGRKKPGAR